MILLKYVVYFQDVSYNSFVGNVENQLPANNSCDINASLTRSFSSIILLEGNTFNLSCTPSTMEVVVLWTHNGIRVLQKRDVRFSPPNLNHTLTIENASECDSGIYTCFAISDDGSVLAGQTITVYVLLGMKQYVYS